MDFDINVTAAIAVQKFENSVWNIVYRLTTKYVTEIRTFEEKSDKYCNCPQILAKNKIKILLISFINFNFFNVTSSTDILA